MSLRADSRLLALVLGGAALLAVSRADAADTKMKDLMKKVGASAASDDVKGMAPLFQQAKSMPPADPAIDGMKAIYDTAITAANAGDMAAAKATCKDCHSKYRDLYKTKYGSKAP